MKNKHIMKFNFILQATLFHEQAVMLIVHSKHCQVEILVHVEEPFVFWFCLSWRSFGCHMLGCLSTIVKTLKIQNQGSVSYLKLTLVSIFKATNFCGKKCEYLWLLKIYLANTVISNLVFHNILLFFCRDRKSVV